VSVLVVAALSARILAQAAQQAGYDVVALDCFGDADTRQASRQWQPLNDGSTLHISRQRLCNALAGLAPSQDLLGWVAGAGFDGQPGLLAEGAALLPLLGMRASDVQRVRDPPQFFAALAALRVAHPPVQFELTHAAAGWLVKDSGGCGAWHIQNASDCTQLRAGQYLQREVAGVPMSATLLCNGSEARVLGINRQLVHAVAGHRFMFCGVVGPVPTTPGVALQVQHIAQQLSVAFHLRGLCSLDFLLDGDNISVLEINPRPPASLLLYPGALAAHLRACSHGDLPRAWPMQGVRGQRIVFAQKSVQLSASMQQRLLNWPHCHDLPNNATTHAITFAAGEPVCSVQAQADSAAQVLALLNQRHDTLLDALENAHACH
jgi:uncharacterized protein